MLIGLLQKSRSLSFGKGEKGKADNFKTKP